MYSQNYRPSRQGRDASPRFSRGGARPAFRSHGSSSSHGGRSQGAGRRGRTMTTFDPSQFINKNPVKLEKSAYTPAHQFDGFGLSTQLTKTIEQMGITTPTPIQDQIIPHILEGSDVIGLAETGTGKTAAFLIPLIEKAIHDHKQQVLIMAPTRELAIQINDEFQKLAKGYRLFSTICVGGTNIHPQILSLKRLNHFIIGTPGRLLDLLERGKIDGGRITSVVLDEADRMLDMGFIHDMRTILEKIPSNRHTLFFSATMSKEAERIVNDFLRKPVTISVKKQDAAESIAQDVVPYAPTSKFETLTKLFEDPSFTRVIIFGAMKHSVEKLGNELSHHGIKAESIHGNKNHGQRQRALKNFKEGRVRVLVATDVAARGIHVDDVSHVINYDLPNTFEDYVHRIGRTGRGSKRGMALTFIPNTVKVHTDEGARDRQSAPARRPARRRW
jgi:ATP-dependent RNA helicase RhlE